MPAVRGEQLAPDWPLPGLVVGSPVALNSGCWKAGQAILQEQLRCRKRQAGQNGRAGSSPLRTRRNSSLRAEFVIAAGAAPAPKPLNRSHRCNQASNRSAGSCAVCQIGQVLNGRGPLRHQHPLTRSDQAQLSPAAGLCLARLDRGPANRAGLSPYQRERSMGLPTVHLGGLEAQHTFCRSSKPLS